MICFYSAYRSGAVRKQLLLKLGICGKKRIGVTGITAASSHNGKVEMYVPKADQIADIATLHRFINDYSFATVISIVEGRIFGTRLPMLLDPSRGQAGALIGHLARANPQWHSFDGRTEVMVAFDGPHAYISPNWYVTAPAVPTWNYAAVHAYGRPRTIEDQAQLDSIVDRLVAAHESCMPNPWPAPGQLPAEIKARLIGAIVGFEMEIERIEGKFKFGAHRPKDDQLSMIRYLEESPLAPAHELAVMIKSRL
jgi:transcriptional regulator